MSQKQQSKHSHSDKLNIISFLSCYCRPVISFPQKITSKEMEKIIADDDNRNKNGEQQHCQTL